MKKMIIMMFVLFIGSVAMADAVVGYADSYLRLVDDETTALGSYNPLGSGVTLKCVAPLANGNFAAVYEAGADYYARIFDGTTMAAGSYAYLGSEVISNIAGLANGDFVISYGGGILRLADGETAALGNYVNLGAGVIVRGITPLANGNIAAIYDDGGNNYARIFDGKTMAAGSYAYLGSEVISNIAGLANGDFVISYGGGILRLADGETAALGSYIDLGAGTTVNGLAALANGNIAAAYDAGGANYARIFDGTTMAAGSYAYLGSDAISDIAGLANGNFIISYGGGVLRLVDGETAALGNYNSGLAGETINDLAGDLVVPEPATMCLLCVGGLMALVRRKTR